MSLAIFNRSLLEEWKQIDPERWQQMVEELIQLFFSSARADYEKLLNARNLKDWESVRYSAHRLKASCGNVGAEAAHSILNEIESLCHSKDEAKVDQRLKTFESIFSKTISDLMAYHRETQAA